MCLDKNVRLDDLLLFCNVDGLNAANTANATLSKDTIFGEED